jgi:hypothetical protein
MDESTHVKTVVRSSRHWHEPNVAVGVYTDGIKVEISLEDLIKCIITDMKHPIWIQTRSKMESEALAVVEAVLNKKKESTNYV